ncbi:MAG: cation:proton antiporter [Corynebacterium sp.]|nr:cation:proton antiporter [Corynebacterium sp.]
MTLFISICIGILALCAISLVVLIVRTKDLGSRALLGDAVFYLMICIFLGANFFVVSQIAYDVAILGALLGILSTVGMARILSKGRR